MNKIPLFVVAGPTASGKTAFSVELAKKINAEIISFDSMQIYKELTVSTAKPSQDEMQGIKHHLIDCISVTQDFSVAEFCEVAKEIIFKINSRGKNVVLVGGTGLYIDSLVNNIDFSNDNKNEEIRKKLEVIFNNKGADYLYNLLVSCDKESAESIHPNNTKRVIRALEIYYSTGLNKSKHIENSRKNESPFSALYFGINYLNRDILYERINKRVDLMIQNGLVEEAKNLFKIKNLKTSAQAIGCKELLPFINGSDSLEHCIDKLKMESRRYAKRQITWFKRNKKINWLYFDENSFEELLESTVLIINNFIKECNENG